MVRGIDRKGLFGRITTAVIEESIAGKEVTSKGERSISKAGSRALEKRHGRTMWGIGTRVVTNSPLQSSENIRDIDLAKILKNAGSKFVSYHRNKGVVLSHFDNVFSNRLGRFFYSSVKHLSAIKGKNRIAPKMFAEQMKIRINEEIEKMSRNLPHATVEKLSEYTNVLGDFVTLQMSHYSGTGLRNLKLNNIVRVASTVDILLAQIKDSINPVDGSIDCALLETFKEWLTDVEKHSGHKNTNDFVKKVYTAYLKQRNMMVDKDAVYPQSVEEVESCALNLKKMLVEANKEFNSTVEINTDVILQRSVYESLMSTIERLEIPISRHVANNLLSAVNELRTTVGLQPFSTIADILPEDGIIDEPGKKQVEHQNLIATSYINFLEMITARFNRDYQARQDIEEASQAVRKYFPHCSSILSFANKVQDFIDSGGEYRVRMALEEGSEIGSPFPSSNNVVYKGLRSLLESKNMYGIEPNPHARQILHSISEQLDFDIRQESSEKLEETMNTIIAQDNTSARSIRRKRIMNALYNSEFGKTFIGQAVRTVVKAGVVIGGGVLAALALPGVLLATGGNALLQAIHVIELNKLGVTLGITGAGLLPSFISPLFRHIPSRKIRKLLEHKPKDALKEKVSFGGRKQYRNDLEKKERERLAAYNRKKYSISSDVQKALFDFQVLCRDFELAKGSLSKLIMLPQETRDALQALGQRVDSLLEEGKRNEEDTRVLEGISRSLLSMVCLSNLENELNIQKTQGNLKYNGMRYQWVDNRVPQNSSQEAENSILSGMYLLSRLSTELYPDSLFAKQIEYDGKVIKERLDTKEVSVGIRSLVKALDSHRIVFLQQMMRNMKAQNPDAFAASSFCSHLERELQAIIGATQSGAVNNNKSLSEITAEDIQDALKNGSLVELLKRALQMYSPYQPRQLPLQELQRIHKIFDSCEEREGAVGRGAFFTELMASCLYIDSQKKENRAIMQWVVDSTTMLSEKEEVLLTPDIELKEEYVRESLNLPVRESSRPGTILLEQIRTLKRFISDSSMTRRKNVDSSSNYPSDFSDSLSDTSLNQKATSYTRDIVADACLRGNISELLAPELLEFAYSKGLLGEIAAALVRISIPKDEQAKYNSSWVHSLFGAIGTVENKYQRALKALVAIEIDEQLLLSSYQVPDERKRVAEALVEHVGKRDTYGNVILNGDLDFNREHVSSSSPPPLLWRTKDVRTALGERLTMYLRPRPVSIPPAPLLQSGMMKSDIRTPVQQPQAAYEGISPAALKNQRRVLKNNQSSPTDKVKEERAQSTSTRTRVTQDDSFVVTENEVLRAMYDEVKKAYQRLQSEGILTDSTAKVKNPRDTIDILSTYIMLDSMKIWSHMPGQFSSYRSNNTEIPQDIERMLQSMKRNMIDLSMSIGKRRLHNSSIQETEVKGDRVVANGSSFNTLMRQNTFIPSSDGGQELDFTEELIDSLLPFARYVYQLNVQRGLRQRADSKTDEARNLRSAQVYLSDIVQNLLIQSTKLREAIEEGK